MAETKYIRTEVLQTRLDQDLIIFDETSGTYLAANSTAAEIWTFLEKPRSISELTELLTEMYDVDQSTCTIQTRAALEKLQSLNLIKEA